MPTLLPHGCTRWPPLLAALACLSHCVLGLDNGAAPLPPMGMSTWDAFGFNVSAQKLMEWADKIVACAALLPPL